MYGWRARVGHVAPSRGDTLVYEFYRMLPEGFREAVTGYGRLMGSLAA